jgi:hypothetical protein
LNVILEGSGHVRYFTDLGETLDALQMRASDYDWFVSDIETNREADVFDLEDRWISGGDLQALLDANRIQFIYAVFSAFPKGYRRQIEVAPRVYDNADYWGGTTISTQLPDALFEIACWDSSATILIGLSDQAIGSFRQKYPGATSLEGARK